MTRRIVFINRFFYPDHSATSQILSDLAFHLSESGRDVHVITSTGSYDDPTVVLPAHEQVRGVTIHRVCTPRHGRGSLAGRAIDYLSMYRAFAVAAYRLAEAGDIVVVKTDPPLLSVAIMPVARLRKFLQVNWLQDLYPEVAERLGVKLLVGPVGRTLAVIRNASLRGAALNVAIGERMATLIAGMGVAQDKIVVAPNWCDDTAIGAPVADNALRRAWGLTGKFVVGYSGNLGRAHEYRTLLHAAGDLREEKDIVFLFIGGGHLTGELKYEIQKRGLSAQFQFRPYQDSALLPQSLALPDVHWLSLRPEMEGLIVPSKFYGVAAAGRPTIAVTDRDGEIARLVRRFDCGVVIAPGEATALGVAIRKMRDAPALVEAQGRNARAMIEGAFRRQHAFAHWNKMLAKL